MRVEIDGAKTRFDNSLVSWDKHVRSRVVQSQEACCCDCFCRSKPEKASTRSMGGIGITISYQQMFCTDVPSRSFHNIICDSMFDH